MESSRILNNNYYYLTDGGLETTMIFHLCIELNHFAAFELLNDDDGKHLLKEYYSDYMLIARQYGLKFIIEAPTWRANPDWAKKLGYTRDQLSAINRTAIQFMREIAEDNNFNREETLVSGCIGPRGDGYSVKNCMSASEAESYHNEQIWAFALTKADMVTALTLNYSDEAIGIVKCSKSFAMPVVISFTVETNGNLPSGESLSEAIEKVDGATEGYASHFMINCAHPEHFNHVLNEKGKWKSRIRGIRANASTLSHEELDEAEKLDSGNKCSLAQNYLELKKLLPNLQVVGGCCGTDTRHLAAICASIFRQNRSKNPSQKIPENPVEV